MFSYSNWSVLTVSFLVVLYLAMSGTTLCAVLYLTGAKWRNQIRNVATSLYALFPLALVLLIILLAGGTQTFAWLGAPEAHGEHHLPGWHNYPFLVARQIVGILFVMWVFRLFIQRQKVAERSEEDMARFHKIACTVPYVFVLYGTMIAWDFEMTQTPQWHSAIYGMQHFVSNFGMFLAFLVTFIYVLNTRNKLTNPVPDFVYNYLAQFMLAFTILWTYTFFAQYLTIWYGNLPAERDRMMGMQDGDYTVLWWSMLALKFIIPFCALAIRVTRHTPQAIVAVACCMMVGTLFERYNWIAGVHEGKGSIPVLAFIVVAVVVAAIGYVLVRGSMRRDNLIRA